MRRLVTFGLVAVFTVIVASTAQARLNQFPFVVNVIKTGETCRATVEGEDVTSDRLLQLGRASARRRAIIVFNRGTVYRCIGGAIYTLQRAGFAQVDIAQWDGI